MIMELAGPGLGKCKQGEPSTNIKAVTYTPPDNLPKQYCCHTCQDAGLWLGTACEQGSGMWRLKLGLVVPAGAWVATVLHAVKSRLINLVLAQQYVPPSRTLRG
ncbi:MAG: hypothetical protein ACKPKO_41875, partial [Candidatus Fonsibacter sp.]